MISTGLRPTRSLSLPSSGVASVCASANVPVPPQVIRTAGAELLGDDREGHDGDAEAHHADEHDGPQRQQARDAVGLCRNRRSRRAHTRRAIVGRHGGGLRSGAHCDGSAPARGHSPRCTAQRTGKSAPANTRSMSAASWRSRAGGPPRRPGAVDHLAAPDRGSLRYGIRPADHVAILVHAEELARAVHRSLGEAAVPRPDRHVGDRVVPSPAR